MEDTGKRRRDPGVQPFSYDHSRNADPSSRERHIFPGRLATERTPRRTRLASFKLPSGTKKLANSGIRAEAQHGAGRLRLPDNLTAEEL